MPCVSLVTKTKTEVKLAEVVKPKFKKETELQAPKTDNVISPLSKGGTRNSGDEDNRSDEDKKKIRAKNRARIAIDEICLLLMTHCNENNISIATGKDAQVAQAFELGVVIKASEIVEQTNP